MHFPEYTSSTSCHLKETDIGEHIDLWQFCLIGYVAGKFPGFSSLLKFITNSWKHKANFTMHDSGWLIFAFSSELEMLDILGGGPYFVFGRPFILKVMPEFFDFTAIDMMHMPIWVRFPNLPLKCWSSICLFKIASMIGKPVHCDSPTASMTRLSDARIFIEVDLLVDLPTFINLVLPNGSSLSQQVMYESLPHFCKQCRVLGLTVSTCNKGTGHKRKKRSHEVHVRSGCSSPSAETIAVEKQQPYNEGLHDEPSIDPMSTEVAIIVDKRLLSPRRKRTKLAETGHFGAKHHASSNVVHISDDQNVITDVEPPKRQYPTRSRVVATTSFGQ